MKLLRVIYNLLFPLVLVIMLPGFLLRMVRRGNYRHKFGQRFGIYSRRVKEKLAGRQWTWVHAVSVGEVMIALKLISAMRKEWPDLHVVLSTTTSTGYRMAHRHRSAQFEPVYHPLDVPWVVSRAFAVVRPERLVLVEAEIWPNVMAAAKKAGIPAVLVNARLSSRSERRYLFVKPLASALFNQLDALCIQDPSDRKRWEGLGVGPEKIRLTGSIKFDREEKPAGKPARDFRPVLAEIGVRAGMPVILGGSTFDGEEDMLAGIVRDLRKETPGLFLILVPRHAERGREVLRKLEAAGHRAILRQGGGSEGPIDILIVNTTGELRDWYACADVVFIGKSLAANARGGQNPAEALEAGCPVLFGPNMQNFGVLARQLVLEGGAIQVSDPAGLRDELRRLLADPEKRRDMVSRGTACLAVHDGATRRTVELLASLDNP
ncbi:MAG: 3-deoxy-D-manno-octulosonic acid transferase [Terrimicrobiaceae bacterium]